jgi:hypothetical protein
MSIEKYQRLLTEFCTLVRIEDKATVIETGSVLINDVAFSLLYNADDAERAGTMGAYCDFGEVPEHNQVAVLRRLLEVNLFLAGSPMACTFSINPETGHVLLCVCLDLHTTEAVGLVDTLRLCTEEARRWRDAYFLEDAAPMRTPEPAALQRRVML